MAAELNLQGGEAPGVAREDGGPCPEGSEDAAGGGGHSAAAEDYSAGGGDTGDAAQELASTGPGFLQKLGSHLGSHATGDLTHGEEQGQRAVRPADGLVGDAFDTGIEEGAGEARRGRQMEIGEEDETLTQERVLGRLRLLDLHQEVDSRGDLRRRVEEGRPGRLVLRVREAGAKASAPLNQHRVTGLGEGGRARGGESHAVLLHLGLSDRADLHRHLPGYRGFYRIVLQGRRTVSPFALTPPGARI